MLAFLLIIALAASPEMVTIGPGPAVAKNGGPVDVDVGRFLLDVDLVSRTDFAAFVGDHPLWRRDRARALFVDERYLADWASARAPGEDVDPAAPVTLVSWFAARAYCSAQGKRLPTSAEWELAAAASTTKKDARADPSFVAAILDWYGRPPAPLRANHRTQANLWGVRDLHGVVWEWVEDFNFALVKDGRSGDGGALFCGAGASAADPADYAGFMRLAFRSSLEARFALPVLGFRCAKDVLP